MRRLRQLAHVLHEILRELADERAYQRHLEQHHCAHSGAEWRRFCEHHLRAKYQRSRCC
jgi:hypothetical protein